MRDSEKTRNQLVQELKELRERLSIFESVDPERSPSAESSTSAISISASESDPEEQCRNLFESVPAGLCITNPAGDVLKFNKSFSHMTGYTIGELSETGISSVYESEDDRERFLGTLHTQGFVEDFEVKLLRKDGSSFWARLYSCAIRYFGQDVILTTVLDITEHRLADYRREMLLRLLDNIKTVDAVILEAGDLDQMMSDVLQTTLEIFHTDRAWLLYPCDPDAEWWSVSMERTRPEYPGAMALGEDIPMMPEASEIMRKALDKNDIITIDSRDDGAPKKSDEQFSTLSQIQIALYPLTGKPWIFGLHQCSHHRVWTEEEKDLFREVSRRLTDALNSMLFLRDLKASEEKWRILTVHSPDHVMLLDCDGTIRFINHLLPDLSREDVIGKSIFDFTPPAFHQESRECLKSVIESRECGSYQTEYLNTGGEELHFEVRVAPVLEDDGVISLISVSHDITSRVRMENTLIESEKRFRTLFNANRDGYVIVLGGGEILDANPRMLEMMGYSLDEFRGMSFWNITPEKWIQTEREVQGTLLTERGYTDLYEKEYIRKDGSVFPVEVQAYILEQGRDLDSTRIGAFTRDISELKHAEVERERAFSFLQTVIDGFPEDMMVINLDHTITLANKSVRTRAGIDPVSAGRTCYQVSHNSTTPCTGDHHPCPLQQVLHTRGPVTAEHTHYSSDGSEIFVDIHAAPIFNDMGEVIQIIESSRNITDLKIAEEERMKLERQILHTQKLESLGVLAGGIAHDFNNILMAILGNADLALMDLSETNPVRSNVREIEIAAKRAADLSRQMLAYSGKGKFVIQKVDLNEAIDEMTRILEVSISKKAVIKYHYSDNLPYIEADPTQIRQIIMNLVTNASEAIDRTSGVVSITTGAMDCDHKYLASAYIDESLPEGQYVYLEVTDTGAGMDEETQLKLFDPFYTTKFTGRGLGLSAVLGIVRGHNGTIKVYSELGRGTSIKVLIPVCPHPEEMAGEGLAEGKKHWSGSGTVLLVDDEETVLSIGKRMLERLGYDVLIAFDGLEALEIFRKHSDAIDLVILDLTMPHLDGEEAFRELRRVREDVCVLISSGYNEQDVIQRFAGKPLAGFLQKPYVFSDLESKIRGILEK